MKPTSREASFMSVKGSQSLKNRIRELRLKYNMTQKELSEKVHVTSRTIISLEKGKYTPSLMLVYRIACIFDTTIEDLYCLKENKEWEDLSHEKSQR